MLTFGTGDRWKLPVNNPKPNIRYFHPTGEVGSMFNELNYALADGSWAGEALLIRVMKEGEYCKVGSDPEDYTCRECGQTFNPGYWSRGVTYKTAGLCWLDYFWEQKLEDAKKLSVFIISGNFYSVAADLPTNVNKINAGHGGNRFVIRPLDGRPDITTHNLWHGGSIPHHYHDRLPDNASFVIDGRPENGAYANKSAFAASVSDFILTFVTAT